MKSGRKVKAKIKILGKFEYLNCKKIILLVFALILLSNNVLAENWKLIDTKVYGEAYLDMDSIKPNLEKGILHYNVKFLLIAPSNQNNVKWTANDYSYYKKILYQSYGSSETIKPEAVVCFQIE